MKKQDVFALLYQLASPLALMVLGLLLLLSPDSASAMIARFAGWILILVGVFVGIGAILDRRGAVGKGFASVGCVCVGSWLLANPLVLAAGIGRLLGILLTLRGIRDLFLSRQRGHGQLVAAIAIAAGLILTVLPMTTSRLVFRLCGGVILAIGIAMFLDRLKDRRRYLVEGDDPNIIDAL